MHTRPKPGYTSGDGGGGHAPPPFSPRSWPASGSKNFAARLGLTRARCQERVDDRESQHDSSSAEGPCAPASRDPRPIRQSRRYPRSLGRGQPWGGGAASPLYSPAEATSVPSLARGTRHLQRHPLRSPECRAAGRRRGARLLDDVAEHADCVAVDALARLNAAAQETSVEPGSVAAATVAPLDAACSSSPESRIPTRPSSMMWKTPWHGSTS